MASCSVLLPQRSRSHFSSHMGCQPRNVYYEVLQCSRGRLDELVSGARLAFLCKVTVTNGRQRPLHEHRISYPERYASARREQDLDKGLPSLLFRNSGK